MREYSYVVVDVFTKVRFQGNPLAVFPSADGMTDGDMQAIASELNLSETVFILRPGASNAAARFRIFTPRRELDFAGHPTIGGASVLSTSRGLGAQFALEENVGIVDIEVDADDDGYPRFWLTTPTISFFETADAELCARLLNVSAADIAPGMPPQFVSAGSPLLFVCLSSPQAVDRAELQQAYLGEALGSVNSVGTFIFSRTTPDSDTNFDVYARMFAPQTGIPEDPATGGATGPLAGYMLRYKMLPTRDLEFVSEQGVKMGRRSELHVRVRVNRDGEMSIKVGGAVVAVADGCFRLP